MTTNQNRLTKHGTGTPSENIVIAIEGNSNNNHIHFDFINADHFMDTAVGNRARAYRRLRGWSKHALAKRAGISTEDIELFERQPWAVPLRVISAITNALGVAACELSDSLPTIFEDDV